LIGTLFQRVKDVHFVGIGGVGMSGIAEILLALGFHVTGSDLKGSATTERLESLGAEIRTGHDESHIAKADVVVFSSAISASNPELVAAKNRLIPVIPRAEMLAELMRMQTSICVAGMHGKTTTTSMISWVLSQAGLDPTVVIGGKLDTLGGGARLGHSGLLVAEADESDKSFLKLYPTIAIVTNMDLEHLDCYSCMDEIRNAFLEFINKIPFYGFAVLCLDDPQVQNIIPEIQKRFITYGLSTQAVFHGRKPRFDAGMSSCTVYKEERLLGEINLPIPGTHNLVNALAAITVADIFDVPFEVTKAALDSFPGVQRRFTLRGEAAGVRVIDDYGHHPTEIRAVLEAARQIGPTRIAVLFQPHRFTRTKALFEDFLTCFNDADLLYVMEIYPASEKPIPGISGEALAAGIHSRGHKRVNYLPDKNTTSAQVAADLRPGDMLITLGAGDVTRLGPEILEELRKMEASRS
jgi:UDP-N-acetylmuramate--alanine ligase